MVMTIAPPVMAPSRRRLARDDSFQEGDHVGAVPFCRPHEAAELATLPVDQKGAGDADDVQAPHRLIVNIEKLAEMHCADLAVEGVDGVESPAVCGKGNYLEVTAAELGLQAIEGGHFLAAGPAPSGPDVEQQNLAAKCAKAKGRA